jgi:DNA polymerase-4/DNA polymerase IV (DinB-like DNA polymerase)
MMGDKTILHVDMDMFFAAVEIRDNPDLAGKPLIIGALPEERGVVSTCSYEARQYGVRSAMSIKEAYRRCPHGIYMHPNMRKYKAASDEIHRIWNTYTDKIEYISLDEGYLDISGSLALFGGAEAIGWEIKQRTREETGLSCSVGIGYCMTAAKLASEEKKPDGFFVIPDAAAYRNLILDRPVGILFTVGQKTAEKLMEMGIRTVRDLLGSQQGVAARFGKHGHQMIELANGIDTREVTPWYEAEAKSIGREQTFQEDTGDFAYLKSVLRLLAKELSLKLRLAELYAQTITLKITYGDMRSLTRSQSGEATHDAQEMYAVAAKLLDSVERRPIRLVGLSLSGLTRSAYQQITLETLPTVQGAEQKEKLGRKLLDLHKKFGADIIKTGVELEAEKTIDSHGDLG